MKIHLNQEVKILIVDDKPENLLVLQSTFKNTGYTLIEALSGREAFEKAKLHNFACILLDVQMPILDGFETAKAIRRLPNAESTPILFITAIHRSEDFELMGYIAGAVDYLFKPINTDILLAKVAVFVDLYIKTEEIKQKNKMLEEALKKSREADELKEALQIRDDFLMMASHELKTPLTPLSLQLQTFIDLFENGTYQNVDHERLLRMMKTSQGQVERLSRLIYDLVDVSKLTANKLELSRKLMSLNQLVQKVLDDFEPTIKKSGSTVEIQPSIEVAGDWDSFRIEQVIINLLTNALKYGQGNPILISIGEKGNNAFFEIADSGIGISMSDQARIFERFERAVSSKHFNGLGLGLYISKQIVELHGGTIYVNSNPLLGSTFRVELPL